MWVVEVLEIQDPTATNNSYKRNYAAAAGASETYLRRTADPDVGYVGEWHTHQAPLRHSWQDRRELRSLSNLVEHPLALVVLARTRGEWSFVALAAQRGTLRRAQVKHDSRSD